MTISALEQFVASNIRTVEDVEILALLSRSPETFWSADAIAQQLGMKADVVANRSRDLVSRGLLAAGDSGPVFRFAPSDAARRQEVIDLLAAYRDRRVSVINAIYSANLTRLRSFADAFKLGGEKK